MMNEQLQAAMVDILGSVTATAKEGVAFLQGELPDVVHQLLVFKLWENVFETVFFIAVSIALVVLTKWTWKKFKDSYDDFIPCMLTGATVIFILISTVATYMGVRNIILINAAPKIYLIEYAAHLMGKK